LKSIADTSKAFTNLDLRTLISENTKKLSVILNPGFGIRIFSDNFLLLASVINETDDTFYNNITLKNNFVVQKIIITYNNKKI
jgi:hypothetical protein